MSPKNVVILPNTTKQIDPALIEQLVQRICGMGCSIRADEASRPLLASSGDCVSFFSDDALFSDTDVIFVLGGDGSMIDAARRVVGRDIPIAGINFGRLGFLAEIEIGELVLVEQILRGEGTVEERMMLDVSIIRGDSVVNVQTPALNEVALSNGPIPRLLSFELHCDGELVENCYADGMLLSTPTGSTAYSLSAGGPVLDPCMDCICSTPICPQTMNNHPVIFRGDSVLEWRNIYTRCRENKIYLSIDGRESFSLERDDVVRIRRSRSRTHLIRVKKGGFLSALRRKLT